MSCEGEGNISDIIPVTLSLPSLDFIIAIILLTDRLVLTIPGGDDDRNDGREETI